MDDLFNTNQESAGLSPDCAEQETRAVAPVAPQAEENKPSRRRRTERFAGLIEEEPLLFPTEKTTEESPDLPQETSAVQEAPVVRGPWQRDRAFDANAFAGVRVPPRSVQMPSQGVPSPEDSLPAPAQQTRREQPVQSSPVVRRPVEAEGYHVPLQQLGVQETPRVRRPEPMETPRRMRTPETERPAYEAVQEPEAPRGGGRGLIAIIIALLVLAALILGMIMIPEDADGVLGNLKRSVTEPVKELLGLGEEDEKPVPATASSFTATISQATSPYKVVFHMVTSSDVTAVRVVDEQGEMLPTVTTLCAPNSETTIVWMFEYTTETGYEGTVQAQMQDDGAWVDTGLTQSLALGGAVIPAASEGTAVSYEAATPAPADEAAEEATEVPGDEEPGVTDAPDEEPSEEPAADADAEADAVGETAEEATEIPAEQVPGDADEAEMSENPTPLMSLSPTPTLSVTATPTMMPTATPAAEMAEEAAEEANAEPTSEPTAEPTATPTPTPAATPRLEAMADDSADASLISTQEIYKDGKKVTEYERSEPMNMPASDEYLTRTTFGVTTFRGNAFRQNAAVGTVDSAVSLALEWTVEAGSVAGESRNYYGIGWTNQPVIAKWPSDIRKSMQLEDARKEQKNLKEVIIAGLDGKIYFLDLLDGTATREAIDFGYPMRSTPTLHPLSYPMMTVGQYARKLKSGTSKNIGLYYYNLLNQSTMRMIDGLDSKLDRAYYSVGAFDTSALIDRNTNTLIAIGTNGLLYTETLSMEVYGSSDGSGIVYKFNEPTESVTLMSHTKGQKEAYAAVESSLAMYGSYAYYADMDGILRCVDTTTMTVAWAVDTGDAVRAAIALDLEEGEDGNTLWLYTANLVNNGRTKGNVTIRRFNAMTGEEDWAFAIHCADGSKKDVTFNTTVTPGAMASPVIGQNGLSDLVYFTLSSVSATGAKELSGNAAMAGVIIAFDKASGTVVWHKEMEAYCYSSPVAVYDESGKGWIIQACSSGTIYLMDGLTGETVSTLAVTGVIEGSPAVYGNMLVIGTTGKGTSYIYGISIK